MALKLYLYTAKESARLKYIAELIFTDILGLDFEITTDLGAIPGKSPILNYGDKKLKAVTILPQGLLFEKHIREFEVSIGTHEGETTLFPAKGDLPYDIFSAGFYLVSRYEEYLPHKRDKHDRFEPSQSIAFRNGFLDKPIVHIWAEQLKAVLQRKYPELEFKGRTYSFINTIDVDYAYAYLGKGMVRTGGALLRDLFSGKFSAFKARMSVLLDLNADPFNTFDYLLDMHRKHHLNSVFFFHVGDYDVNDKSIPLTSERFQSLIKGVNDYTTVGVHPSYKATKNEQKLHVEINRLTKVIHQPVVQSRFHFLRFTLPTTYRALIKYGIQEDYTMGYASETGFRASVCIPFRFYDLDLDLCTDLKVYPIYLMEATLKYYKNIKAENAMLHFSYFIEEVKKYNGTFIGLWHNDSLSSREEWAGWKEVYEQMVEMALE